MKKTVNVWEYKGGINAIIANCACSSVLAVGGGEAGDGGGGGIDNTENWLKMKIIGNHRVKYRQT